MHIFAKNYYMFLTLLYSKGRKGECEQLAPNHFAQCCVQGVTCESLATLAPTHFDGSHQL